MSAGTGRGLSTVAPRASSAERKRAPAFQSWPIALLAAIVLVVAYENGGYGLSSRTIAAVAVWWTIIVGVGFGFLPRARPGKPALVVGSLLAGFAVWTLASTTWAANPESTFNEFNRVSLYLAVYILTVAATTRAGIGLCLDGLRLGIVATALVSLSSRLFPHLFSTREIGVFLPYAVTRLSFPVGYWNGLAIFTGLAFPLSFRSALVARRPLARALAVAFAPALASVVYLASSRGGVVVSVVGALVFLAATERRWAAVGVIVAAAVGSVGAIIVLIERRTLVNGPLNTSVASSEGRSAALLICVCCVLSAALLLVGERMLAGRFAPSRGFSRTIVGAAFAIAIAGIALAHPVRRFDAFRQPLSAGRVSTSDFATAHLLSGNGSGRWQFWTAAVHEFTSAPILGRGAGSYQFWWAQHASFTYFLKNAHSLYLEVLGELGIVGFALIVGVFAGGLAAAVIRVRRSRANERITLAAVTGVLVAFVVGAGIDWIWQLTVVAAIGVVALGLATGPATDGAVWNLDPFPRVSRRRSRLVSGLVALVVVWGLIVAEAIPWLASARISDSQAAVRHGDLAAAGKDALDAKSLEPWASSPYLQLALVAEERRDLPAAEHWISAAIKRDSTDWTVWYVASRIARESSHPAEAIRRYAKAKSLNPRSPLFNPAASG